MPSQDVSDNNRKNAELARELYMKGRSPSGGATDWREALRQARSLIADAMRSSEYLRDPAGALADSGSHMTAFRHLMAPPMSQDQFKLVCPSWSKGSEKKGRVPVSNAKIVAASLLEWIDRASVPWLATNRPPTRAELRQTLQRVSALIAQQRVQTVQRNRLSNIQESAVVNLLLSMGWAKRPSTLIKIAAAVPSETFMHKTRFATETRPAEVDVACGLGGTIVAAIECKVTNDETNSIKRINDVVKKAEAWQRHWGNFIKTVAVLQGVIAPKEVDRLSDANIHVFWSHRAGSGNLHSGDKWSFCLTSA